MSKSRNPVPSPPLVEVHARLFFEDVEAVKKLAAERGIPWQVELRLIVRQALKGRNLKIIGE